MRRWCEALNQEYRQRLAGLAHKIFLKLLKAKREVPGAAERKTLAVRAVRLRADGRHLQAGPRGAVRQAFAAQILQALCGPRVWRAAWPPASWSTRGRGALQAQRFPLHMESKDQGLLSPQIRGACG